MSFFLRILTIWLAQNIPLFSLQVYALCDVSFWRTRSFLSPPNLGASPIIQLHRNSPTIDISIRVFGIKSKLAQETD